MKVTGCTFIRNAVKYDYPVLESIRSVLPLCDQFVVAVGDSEDGTRELIEGLGSDKIRIIDTVWDDTLREGGRVLAVETNKALDAVAEDTDWVFYIQADEVLHEKSIPAIKEAMKQFLDQPEVEGLLFNYIHFYGSYDFIGDSRRWYRREIRVIRNDRNIRSYRDAQGFRKNGEKLKVKLVKADMCHYGWVKHPKFQQAKQEIFHKYWHDDRWVEQNVKMVEEFDYSQVDSVAPYRGEHPAVMKPRVEKINWKFSFDPSRKNFTLRLKLLFLIEKWTGIRIGEYKNYKII